MLIYDYGGYNGYDDSNLFAGIAVLGVVTVAMLGLIAVEIIILLTMQKALKRCSPTNRTLEPNMVWLQLIPLFGIAWSFVVVLKTSESLGAEMRYRNIPAMERNPGKGVGLASCILSAWVSLIGWIPYVGFILTFLPGIAGMICWIIYWVRISRTAGTLDLSPAPAQAA